MPMPVLDTFAANWYTRLGDMTTPDANNAYALANFLKSIGTSQQDIYDIVVDQPDGTPGWGILLDPVRCPAVALPWLGQLVGVSVDTTQNEAAQRAQIIAVGGWRRGQVASMLAASKPFLTGTKYSLLVEKYGGDAYAILYVTHTAETPADPTAMQAAVIAQKPAGLNITFNNVVGQLWGDVKNNHATWQAVKTAYATWNDVRNGP